MYRFDFEGVPLFHHIEFFKTALQALEGGPHRKMFFGGGIRGGKTFLCLFILIVAARRYPGIRIHIVRESLPSLLSTVVPSIRKLLNGVRHVEKKSSGNYHFRLPNGSEIYLFSENYDADKDLDRFKGLETNIFFLEQIEELQEHTFQKAIERVGSYIIPGMPAPLILSTMNPTMVPWVRKITYYPWRDHNLPEDTYVQMITAAENPFVTDFQRKNWKTMDPVSYQQYVEGDWDAISTQSAFFYAFNEKHIKPVRPSQDIVISFDFNVTPLTCTCANVGPDFLHVFFEIRQDEGALEDMIKKLVPLARNKRIRITGDSTGQNRNVIFKNKNLYQLILNDFAKYNVNVPLTALNVPKKNLDHIVSRQICNNAFNVIDIKIDPSCENLIQDLKTVKFDTVKQKIDKKDASATHLFDTFRYIVHTYFYEELIKKVYKS